jgi:hypothetical protein
MPDFLLTASAPPETPHIFYISAPCPAININLVLNFQKNAMLTWINRKAKYYNIIIQVGMRQKKSEKYKSVLSSI